MSTLNLDRLFAPRSVAVIGATERSHAVGQVVLRNLIAAGYEGPIFPVNPKHGEIQGLKAYPDVASLPATPDLAVICTPAATVAGLIDALGRRGTKAAIVISAGFGEGGATPRHALLDAARPYGLRILGPNCVGLLSPRIRMNASFAHMAAEAGSLAFVAQSGALCTAVIDWAGANGIGFTQVVSLGDMLDVDFGDVLDYLGTDSHTRGVLLYVEAITSPRKFLSAARAVSRNKPIIAIKAGRHEAGVRAARSHTGALAGSYSVYESALQRAGIVLVDSVEALFDAAETLALSRRALAGNRLAILTNGGGPGVLAADSVATQGGTLATLAPETIAALNEVLPDNWSHSNPVDIVGDCIADRYLAALRVLDGAPGVDAVLVMHVPTALLPSEEAARALAVPMAACHLPMLSCWMGGVSAEPARALLSAQKIPCYPTPKAAVSAYMTLVKHQRTQELLMQTPASVPEVFTPDIPAARAPIEAALAAGRDQLTEVEAKAVLRAYGFTIVDTRLAATPEAAVAMAVAIGFPVVIKLVSPEITHKSDVGGVVLNLESPEAVRTAALAMATRVQRQFPQATIEGYSVQQMVRRPRAREVILGVATDPVFGPVILFGDGGTAVEVLADKAIALPPLNMLLAADLLKRTRVHKLLRGYRDHPAADLEAIAVDLVRLSQLVIDVPEIVELDINPLLADGEGTIALDARIRVAQASGRGTERLAIRPYPVELEETTELPGMGKLLLRPIRPEDEAAHLEFCEKVDPQDMYFRFFTRSRDFSHDQLARFTQIDYDREMAFIAVHPGPGAGFETVGVVRAVSDANNTAAEFGILVRSDLQGKGLGVALMRKIIAYCRARGTARLYGHILPTNRGMLALAAELGFELDHATDDNVVIANLKLQN
jgi:acetyltransferase